MVPLDKGTPLPWWRQGMQLGSIPQLALGQVPHRGLSSMGLGLLGKPPGKLSVIREVLQRGLGTVKVNVQPGRGSSASFLISIYQALPNING